MSFNSVLSMTLIKRSIRDVGPVQGKTLDKNLADSKYRENLCCSLNITRSLHAGAYARLQLFLENSKTKCGITMSRKKIGLPPLLVWVPLFIVNN